MKKNWTIRTGDYKALVKAERNIHAFTAAVLAFEKRAPKSPGLLTQCVHPDGAELYISTVHALEKAGYKVNK